MAIDRKTLASRVRASELSAEEKSALLELIATQKKYGLLWEEKAEAVEEELRSHLPVLKEVADRRVLSDAPDHLLIEGDNLPALHALQYTHAGKIDVIYIDPPYNTGNKDFCYNDSYVDKTDAWRHSKWLSFMGKRLKLARQLLKDTGVIFISIDDNEQAQLKLLCDEIFGEAKFFGQLIVETATDNNPRQISTEHEYLSCFAQNASIQGKWISSSEGAVKIQNEYLRLKELNNDPLTIQKQLKKWVKDNKDSLPRVSHYSCVDAKGVYYADNPSNTIPGEYKYIVTHPITGKICVIPPKGFRFPENTFNEMLKSGDIEFGNDETIIPKPKRRLLNVKELLRSVYYEDGRGATGDLLKIFGKKVFNNPKSINLLMHFMRFIPNTKSAIILDFFAGSGTTLHAAMALNAEDGGNRRCILVTNNENEICENVTYERNRRVIQGYAKPNGEVVPGLSRNNLRYYRVGQVARRPGLMARKTLAEEALDLLRVRENCHEPREGFDGEDIRVFSGKREGDPDLVVVLDSYKIPEAVSILQKLPGRSVVYVYAPGAYAFDDDFEAVSDRIELRALPDPLLKTYAKNLPKANAWGRKPASAQASGKEVAA